MRIKRMPAILADQIAAGEVIERPSSVVKELVENSIDAGSSFIKIAVLSKGGFAISVDDDGHGIFQEDLRLAFSRHATSKIRELEDFYSLKTLGFRGEALASIASVSKALIKSRRREELSGGSLKIVGGEIIEEREIPKNPGTYIEVKDLFFNTPARKKHQRQVATEFGHISSIATQLALASPKISISLYHNEKKIFQTPGQGDLKGAITSLYGERISSSLLPLSFAKEYMELEGFLSAPSYSRKTPCQLFFFVNHRSIKSPFLKKIIEESLKGHLPKGRFPFALLKIQINPVHIDVNVHPQKLTIRFSRPEGVANLLKGAFAKVIQKEQIIPSLSPHQERSELKRERPLNLPLSFGEKRGEEMSEREEAHREEEALKGPQSIDCFDEHLIPLGQLYQTYLLFQGREAFYLMDKHAAHERVLYQKFLEDSKEEKPKSQLLLTPLALQLSPEEKALLEGEEERLSNVGFHWESFGPSSILLRAAPLRLKSFSQEEIKDVLFEVVSGLKEREHDLFSLLACHGAIKAGQHMSNQEIESLVLDLKKTQNPYQCPHGRPTILRMTKKKIEEHFKRS